MSAQVPDYQAPDSQMRGYEQGNHYGPTNRYL